MDFMHGFGAVGVWAAAAGTGIQMVDAMTRGSLRAALEDAAALDAIVKEELRTVPRWRIRERSLVRRDIAERLLDSRDRRRLRHAKWQTGGWTTLFIASIYAIIASFA